MILVDKKGPHLIYKSRREGTLFMTSYVVIRDPIFAFTDDLRDPIYDILSDIKEHTYFNIVDK